MNWPSAGDPRDPFAEPLACGPRGVLWHESRPPDAVLAVPSVADLARVACDIAPAAGNDGPDRVLGPWADEDLPRGVRLAATAAACFFPPDDDAETPFSAWCRRPPAPPVAERAAFRAVARAPWAIRRVIGTDPLRSVDATGLAASWAADETLAADATGLCAPAVGGALLVRAVRRSDGGWIAPIAIALPVCPPEVAIARWVGECAGYAANRSVEAALASHGHVLARRACEWAWLLARRGPPGGSPNCA